MTDTKTSRPALIELADRTVDLEHGRVTGRVQANLTSREVELLAYLVERPGEVVTREELHREVWHISPRVVSRAVDATVTRLRAKMEPDPDQPRHLLTVWGVGYRLELPRAAHRAPIEAPKVADLDRFFGRSPEATDLLQAFQSGCRLVTVTGPPGAGKSRFAVRMACSAAHRLAAEWSWCALADIRTTDELVEAVARVLNAGGGGGGSDPIPSILAHRGPTLLVLDNLEQAAEPAATAIAGWLAVVPGVSVLATSRSRLGLPGEHVVDLGPLPHADALGLVLDRCAHAGMVLDGDEPGLSELLDRVDRLPLGLELVAAQLELMTPQQLLERLSAAALWLSDDRRDRPARHSSLHAAIATSLDSLGGTEQRALVQVAVFRGPFDLAAAEAVIDVDGIEVATVLRQLRVRSLVRRAGSQHELQIYESVREHARERGLDEGAVLRHARWFAGKARECFDPAGHAATPECMAWMRASATDLHAAFEHALVDDPSDAVAIAAALSQLLMHHGPASRAVDLLNRALEVATEQSPSVRGHLVRLRGIAHHTQGRREAAIADVGEALALAEQASDPRLRGRSLVLRGATYLTLQRHEEANVALAEAAEVLAACGDLAYLGSALSNQATAVSRLGRQDEARQLYEDALVRHQKNGNTRGAAVTLGNIGLLLVERGDLEAGAERLYEALELNRLACDRWHEGVTLGHLAFAEANLGRAGRAVELARAAEKLLTVHGDRFFRAQALRALAAAELTRGRGEAAADALSQVLDLGMGEADTDRVALVVARWMAGEVDDAERTLDELACTVDRPGTKPRARWLFEVAQALVATSRGVEPGLQEVEELSSRTDSGTPIRLDPYLAVFFRQLDRLASRSNGGQPTLRAISS